LKSCGILLQDNFIHLLELTHWHGHHSVTIRTEHLNCPILKVISVMVMKTIVWAGTWCTDFINNGRHLLLPKFLSAMGMCEMCKNTYTDL
jgi:hypothetical protein